MKSDGKTPRRRLALAVLCLASFMAVADSTMMGVSREGGLLLVLAGTVVGEAGFMFSNVSLTIAGTGATGEDGRGLAAGLLNTSVQLGNAWGLGVVAPPWSPRRPARARPPVA